MVGEGVYKGISLETRLHKEKIFFKGSGKEIWKTVLLKTSPFPTEVKELQLDRNNHFKMYRQCGQKVWCLF